jgi:predicted lipoprotein
MLKSLLSTAFAALMITTGTALASNAPDQQARVQWHQAIAGGYQALAGAAEEFATVSRDYCKAPDKTSRQSVEKAWLGAFIAWQQVRFVDFGPIEENNLAWQFQFWPDPKNLIGRKAAYLLKQEAPVTSKMVAESGVAVQGFPMAEYLLFDEQLNASERALPATTACSLLSAVSGHISANSQALAKNWESFREHYLDTQAYRDTTVRAAMAALEILDERRLAQPMGLRGTGKRSAYAADAWRSGTSTRTIEATVTGLQQYFLPGLEPLLRHSSQPELADRIKTQFEEVQEHFPEVHAPMTILLSDEGSYSKLQGLYVDISQLVNLMNEQAAAELGVIRGFNSSDGD